MFDDICFIIKVMKLFMYYMYFREVLKSEVIKSLGILGMFLNMFIIMVGIICNEINFGLYIIILFLFVSY